MFESQRCIFYKGRDHSHEDHVADGGFHSWHQYNLVHAHVPISKATNNSITEGCEGRNNFEILLGKFGKNTQLGILLFSICVDDMTMAGEKVRLPLKPLVIQMFWDARNVTEKKASNVFGLKNLQTTFED